MQKEMLIWKVVYTTVNELLEADEESAVDMSVPPFGI